MSCTILLLSSLLFLLTPAGAQGQTVLIHIKLIDGQTGKPMENRHLALEDAADYRDISVLTNEFGIASLRISRNATILVENTKTYVRCADEHGGLVHNNFKVSDILSSGLVESISPPNLCGKTSGVPSPGQLTFFVRPWRQGEDL